MKNFILFIGLLVLSSYGVNAQTFSDNENKSQQERDFLERDGSFLTQLNSMFRAAPPSAAPAGSSVFIEQIGSLNTANVSTATNSADIDVLQEGNSNFLDLNYRVSSVVAQINQIGNSNRFVDYVDQPNQNINLDYTQEGNNLTFEKYGTNRLTESMSFRQTGFDKTIIVRSFK